VIAGESVAEFVKEEPEKIKDEQPESIEPATEKQKKPESVKPGKTAAEKQKKSESLKLRSVDQKKSVQTEKEDKKYENLEVEAFMIDKDRANNDLLVRFDIRNVSDNTGTISGRIFVLLKPDLDNAANWLCLPSVPLKAGKPGVPKKGQYFSIAHFKPVKFRVKSNLNSDAFKYATIFVYDDNEELIFAKSITVQGNGE
ncbi:MAG: hypothetical protein U9N77_01420, partial [Thermodesulfobacteriota bacterium]|nr:hypothetical protein [Thermodesulfobacteriota bacterium]